MHDDLVEVDIFETKNEATPCFDWIWPPSQQSRHRPSCRRPPFIVRPARVMKRVIGWNGASATIDDGWMIMKLPLTMAEWSGIDATIDNAWMYFSSYSMYVYMNLPYIHAISLIQAGLVLHGFACLGDRLQRLDLLGFVPKRCARHPYSKLSRS